MSQPGDTVPHQVGPYRLTSKLGEGGMGQVFLGTDEAGRQAAVKLLKPELVDIPEFRTRFAREVDAARRVSGAYTAAVVDADPLADPPWLATEYIPGPSLQQRVIEQGPMEAAAVRDLAVQLAAGLADIHRAGLVHRDLKPSNVIMADGGPRIIDFGISRAADASTLTVTGTVVGTYAYMSPEQITADTATESSDVFALGCVLALAATGVGPFDATSIPAIVHRVVSQPPRLDGVTGELRAAIEACLSKDPNNRPSVDDVRGLVYPDPLAVLQRTTVDPASVTQVVPYDAPTVYIPPPRPPVPLLRRRGVIVGAITALCVTVVAVTAIAIALWPDGEPGGSDSASSAPPLSFAVADERTLDPRGSINALTFSPDGKLLATGNGSGPTELWDVDTGEQIATFAGGDPCSLAFSPDGKTLATGGCDTRKGGVRLWDVSTGDKIATITEKGSMDLAFSPDGESLATIDIGPGDGVRVWDVASGDRILDVELENAFDFTFSPDSATLAVTPHPDEPGSETFEAELWDVRGGDKTASITVDGGQLAFSPDGKTLITANGGLDGSTVSRWDVKTGDEGDYFNITPSSDVVFSSDIKVLATANTDEDDMGGTALWNAETGHELLTLTKEEAYCVAFSSAGKAVATVTSIEDNTRGEVTLWRLK